MLHSLMVNAVASPVQLVEEAGLVSSSLRGVAAAAQSPV